MNLSQKKKDRFLYLNNVYESANGSLNAVFDMNEVGHELGFDDTTTGNIVDYLINEGLLEAYGLGGYIKLSHWGLKEVEQAIEHPNESTEHFSPIINYNYNIHSSGNGSVINTGNDNQIFISNNRNTSEINEKIQSIVDVISNDQLVNDKLKDEALVFFNQLKTNLGNDTNTPDIMDKIFMYGGSIGSIGSLVVGLIQLFVK